MRVTSNLVTGDLDRRSAQQTMPLKRTRLYLPHAHSQAF